MANDTAKIRERAFILEFIQLYRDLPELWNVKSKEYYDREKKKNSYNLLTTKYREMYPTATRDDVKKKVNIIRTNYRKEMKKHLQSLESGEEYTYKPALWYYNEMCFLQNVEIPPESHSTIDFDKEKSDIQSSMLSEDEVKVPVTERPYCFNDSSRSTDDTTPPLSMPRLQKKIAKVKSRNEKINVTSKAKWSSMESEHVRQSDMVSYQYWGLACAEDLQKMDPMQQIYAKKAIAEILMEGSLGLLHRHSVKINDPASLQNDPLSINTPQNRVTP